MISSEKNLKIVQQTSNSKTSSTVPLTEKPLPPTHFPSRREKVIHISHNSTIASIPDHVASSSSPPSSVRKRIISDALLRLIPKRPHTTLPFWKIFRRIFRMFSPRTTSPCPVLRCILLPFQGGRGKSFQYFM